MFKKIFIFLFFIPITQVTLSMESGEQTIQLERLTKEYQIFKELVDLMIHKDQEQVEGKLCEHQKIWPALFLEIADEQGNSLLHLACINHCDDVIDYLLRNNFPFWRVNHRLESIYDLSCYHDKSYRDCNSCLDYLPKQSINKPSRHSIITRGGNLELQFRIAQKYGLEKQDLENLINDLIGHCQFIEAQELIQSSTYLNLYSSLISAISVWKKYPKNGHIDELIQILLAKFADNQIEENELDELFLNHEGLKIKYDEFSQKRNNLLTFRKTKRKRRSYSLSSIRTSPRTEILKADTLLLSEEQPKSSPAPKLMRQKKSHLNNSHNKTLVIGALGLIAGFALSRMLNHKSEIKTNLNNYLGK